MFLNPLCHNHAPVLYVRADRGVGLLLRKHRMLLLFLVFLGRSCRRFIGCLISLHIGLFVIHTFVCLLCLLCHIICWSVCYVMHACCVCYVCYANVGMHRDESVISCVWC